MSWIAQAGGPIGKTAVRTGHHGSGYQSDDEDIGGFMEGLPTFRGVPLCGADMCGVKGVPPKTLPQPGISCVNRDRPCLPCDIVNLPLRTSVIGVKVKRAVDDAQKRYFCRVWNLLFSYLLPDHVPGLCPDGTDPRLSVEDHPPPPSPPPPPPQQSQTQSRRANLRYNIWNMPMPDASKGKKSSGTQQNAQNQASNSNASLYQHFSERSR